MAPIITFSTEMAKKVGLRLSKLTPLARDSLDDGSCISGACFHVHYSKFGKRKGQVLSMKRSYEVI